MGSGLFYPNTTGCTMWWNLFKNEYSYFYQPVLSHFFRFGKGQLISKHIFLGNCWQKNEAKMVSPIDGAKYINDKQMCADDVKSIC